MNHDQEAAGQYPHGRGYGHDYMRGGEVLGGYGYAEREEYAKNRGELTDTGEIARAITDAEQEQGARS